MIAQITKIETKPSKYGSMMKVVFFKGTDSKSYYTYIYEKMFNAKRWKKVLKEGTVLKGLKLLKGKKNLIDADSRFIEIKEEK